MVSQAILSGRSLFAMLVIVSSVNNLKTRVAGERNDTSLNEDVSEPVVESEKQSGGLSHNDVVDDLKLQTIPTGSNADISNVNNQEVFTKALYQNEAEPIFQELDTDLSQDKTDGSTFNEISTENDFSPTVDYELNTLGLKYEDDGRTTRLSEDFGQSGLVPKDTSTLNSLIRDRSLERSAVQNFMLTPKSIDPQTPPGSGLSHPVGQAQHENDASIGLTSISTTPERNLDRDLDTSFCYSRDKRDLEALILKICPCSEVSNEDVEDILIRELVDELCNHSKCKEEQMGESIGYTSIWGRRRKYVLGKQDLLKYSQTTPEVGEDGKVNRTEKSDVLRSDEYAGSKAEALIVEDDGVTNRTILSNSINTDFVQGLDGIDKFLEEVEPPDELDVSAAGSSMQDVLMRQGLQILKKRVAIFISYVKKSFSATSVKKVLASRRKADGTIVILKRNELDRLWKQLSMAFEIATQKIEHVLDNLFHGKEAQEFEANFIERESDLESIRRKMMNKNMTF